MKEGRPVLEGAGDPELLEAARGLVRSLSERERGHPPARARGAGAQASRSRSSKRADGVRAVGWVPRTFVERFLAKELARRVLYAPERGKVARVR